MNLHLDNAIEITAKIDALLYAIDEMYMDGADDRNQYLHLTLRDLVDALAGELDLLAKDKTVTDAIYAANAVRRACTLKK